MKKEEDKRRFFLKHILAGSAVMVGVAAIIKPIQAKSGQTASLSSETLYRESEDFKKYYNTL